MHTAPLTGANNVALCVSERWMWHFINIHLCYYYLIVLILKAVSLLFGFPDFHHFHHFINISL
jgi:hypothetical protein